MPRRREFGAGRVEVGRVQVEQRDARAALGECAGDGLADAARAAGDDDDLVVQLHAWLPGRRCESVGDLDGDRAGFAAADALRRDAAAQAALAQRVHAAS